MNDLTRLSCEETFRRLNDYLDRMLTPEEMRLVERHLETCAACASEYRFEGSVLDGVRANLRRLDIPADLMAKISARLDEAERREE